MLDNADKVSKESITLHYCGVWNVKMRIIESLIKCLNETQTIYMMDELHKRVCGIQFDGHTMAVIVLHIIYY